MIDKTRVLITGTTSGLGKGLAQYFAGKKMEVLSVNRQDLDISSYNQVYNYLKKFKEEGRFPAFLILNAGINKPDNIDDNFDIQTFNEVWKINFDGVFNFVSSLQKLGVKEVRITGISSTSNIVANPGHVGYSLSKMALSKGFEFLRSRDPRNKYKTVELGPVLTAIDRYYKRPSESQNRIFNLLATDVSSSAKVIGQFALNDKPVLYYPIRSALFFQCMKMALKVFPGLYRGRTLKPPRHSER